MIQDLGRGRWATIAVAAIVLIGAGGAVGARGLGPVNRVSSTSPAPGVAQPTTTTASTPLAASTAGGASPTNLVQVVNQADAHLRVLGRVQFNEIPTASVTPVNDATAAGVSCNGCQTMAVAVQINVLSTRASYVAPANTAVAANGGCGGCTTVAEAFQYNIAVADPTAIPARVRQLVAEMQQVLATLPTSGSLADAQARVNAVLSEYQDLAQWLKSASQTATEPTTPNAASVIPSPAASPAGSTPTPAASPTSTASASPAPSPSPSPSPSPT